MSRAAERDARATFAELDAQRRLCGRRHDREVETARDELKDLIVSKYVHLRHSYRRTDLPEIREGGGAGSGGGTGSSLFPGGCRNSLSLRRYLADEKTALKARLSPSRRRRKLVSQQARALAPFPEHIIAAGKSTTAILRDYDRHRADTRPLAAGELQSASLPDFRQQQRPGKSANGGGSGGGGRGETRHLVMENARRIRQRLDYERANTLSSEPRS